MKNNPHIPQIAILVSTSRGWGRRLVKGILAYANEVGPWQVWVKPDAPDSFNELPHGWQGDGVIARVVSPNLATQLMASQLPVVNVADDPIAGFSAPQVQTDDNISTRMAVDHFIDRGFRNIAYIGSLDRPNAAKFAKKFERTLAELGLNCSVFPHQPSDSDPETTLTQWLLSLPKPIGILTGGNNYGIDVINSCMEAGIPVPHDVAVLSGGYDELLNHSCYPALSGIITPTEQIGYKSAELLHQMMLGKSVQQTPIYLPPPGITEHLSTNTLAVNDPKLIQVVEYLRQHAFESIAMDDLAKSIPMARRSLERRFKQAFNRSPLDEIRRLRVDRARKLLIETDMPMQLIAEACGYATYNYLTHVFKQNTGINPSQYRNQFRCS